MTSAVALVIMALRGHENSFSSWTYLTFTQNIAMAQDGSLGFAWLAQTWSLAIEEQFYLILRFFIWLLSKEKLPYLLVGLILFGLLSHLALIFFYPNSSEFAFLWLLPAAGEPLFWGVLGAWMTRNQKWLDFLNSHRKVLYLVFVTLSTSTYLLALWFPPTYGFTLLGLLYISLSAVTAEDAEGFFTHCGYRPPDR